MAAFGKVQVMVEGADGFPGVAVVFFVDEMEVCDLLKRGISLGLDVDEVAWLWDCWCGTYVVDVLGPFDNLGRAGSEG